MIPGFGVSGGNTAGTTGTQPLGTFVFAGGNNITLSQSTGSAGIHTISISAANETQTVAPIGTAVKAIASVGSTGTITRFAPEDHQHAGVAAFAITNTGNTAGNTRSQVGTIFIAATGAITASQSTAAAGNDTVWLSVAAQTVGAGHVLGVSNTGNTAGNSGTGSTGTVVFAASGAITASQSTGAGISTIWYSVAAQTNQSAIRALGASNTGNTAGNTGVSTGIDWVFAGTNNVTVSESTAGGGPNTLWISGAAAGVSQVTMFATSNTTQSSTGTQALSSLMFAGAGIASVGVTGGSVVISVPAGGGAGDGGVFAGVSNLGNTAGSTGTVSTGNFVLVGSNGISLSQSTGAAGSAATVTIQGFPTQSYYELPVRGGVSARSMGAGTVYFQPFVINEPVSMYRLHLEQSYSSQSATTGSITASVSSQTSTSGSGSWGITGTVALYKRESTGTAANSSNLISFYSNSYSNSVGATMNVSWSTNVSSCTVSFSTTMSVGFLANIDSIGGTTTSTNSSSGSNTFSSTSTNQNSFASNTPMSFGSLAMSNVRPLLVPFATSLSPGEYWLGHNYTSDNASNYTRMDRVVNLQNPDLICYTSNTSGYNEIGRTVTFNSSNVIPGWGSYSASSNTTTTFPISNISNMSQLMTWFNVMAQTK